jgi:hypothetical protein
VIPFERFAGAIMANESVPPSTQHTLQLIGNESAPFVYFDNAVTYGVLNGAIQLELTANTIVPGGGPTKTATEFVVVAHLRCSPAAAIDLKNAIEKALLMLTPPDDVKPN